FHDLSIIGRIAPLLLVSKTKEEFLAHAQAFVSLTHNCSQIRRTQKKIRLHGKIALRISKHHRTFLLTLH
ncbi:MAG TPA: hypothetical protein VFX66_02845, partial [Sulfuricurvum sp.]|nr:hypothetical protein [Sulfuricurvum sp.]